MENMKNKFLFSVGFETSNPRFPAFAASVLPLDHKGLTVENELWNSYDKFYKRFSKI